MTTPHRPDPDFPYGRVWPQDPGPYSPPVLLPPVMRAVSVPVMAVRSKPTAVNPRGSVKSVAFAWPTTQVSESDATPHIPGTPPGVASAMKFLLGMDVPVGLVMAGPGVAYARGYDVSADGENKRDPIWEERMPDDEDPRRRVRVGEHDPRPVDSVVVRVRWNDDAGVVRAAVGMWIDGKPDTFLLFERSADSPVSWRSMTSSAWVKAIKAPLVGPVAEGVEEAERAA